MEKEALNYEEWFHLFQIEIRKLGYFNPHELTPDEFRCDYDKGLTPKESAKLLIADHP